MTKLRGNDIVSQMKDAAIRINCLYVVLSKIVGIWQFAFIDYSFA